MGGDPRDFACMFRPQRRSTPGAQQSLSACGTQQSRMIPSASSTSMFSSAVSTPTGSSAGGSFVVESTDDIVALEALTESPGTGPIIATGGNEVLCLLPPVVVDDDQEVLFASISTERRQPHLLGPRSPVSHHHHHRRHFSQREILSMYSPRRPRAHHASPRSPTTTGLGGRPLLKLASFSSQDRNCAGRALRSGSRGARLQQPMSRRIK